MGKINSKKLETQLKGKNVVLLVLSKNEYSEKVFGLIAIISKKTPSICYISVNKPAKALVKLFDAEKMNTKKFQFIDCVSSSDAGSESAKDSGARSITYISSPRNLTALSIAINNALRDAPAKDAVFVDALTTFLIYNEGLTVVRFAHSLISAVREKNKMGFFIALRNDISNSLLDDLSMFVDGIIEV